MSERSAVNAHAPPVRQAGGSDGDNGHDVTRETVARLRTLLFRRAEDARRDARGTHLDLLVTAFTDAAAKHRQLMKPFEGTPPVERDDRVRAYRAEACRQVLTPLHEALTQHNPGRAVAKVCLTIAEGAPKTDDVPETTAVTEDPAVFRAALDDRLPRRVRKLLARAVRVGSRLRVRSVPLRRIVRYHVHVRVPEFCLSAHEAAQQNAARLAADFERAVAAWTGQVLRTGHGTDRAAPEDGGAPSGLLATAAAFQQALERAVEIGRAAPSDEAFGLEQAHAALERDVQEGGTLLLPRAHRATPEPAGGMIERLLARGAAWARWHDVVGDRLRLSLLLCGLRDELTALRETFETRAQDNTCARVHAAFTAVSRKLDRAAADVDGRCKSVSDSSARDLAATIERIRAGAVADITEAFRDPPLADAEAVLGQPGAAEWERAGEIVAALPDDVVVHQPRALARPVMDPDGDRLAIDLRAIARDALAPPFPQRFKDRAVPLKRRLGVVWSETEQVASVVRYNLDAALDELDESKPREDGSATGDRRTTACDLATGGLRRAGDTLDDLAASLDAPWREFRETVGKEFADDWNDLQSRVEAGDALEERFAGFRTRVVRKAEVWRAQLRDGAVARWSAARRIGAAAWRRAARLVRRGQTAVGVAAVEGDERTATLDALADAAALSEGFPLIYRKLFARTPVTDPAMLAGRARDLVEVRRHFARWRRGQPASALVLVGPPGSGRTSVLNVLHETVFRDADVRQLDLTRRVDTEAQLVAQLAEILGVRLGSTPTFDALEAALQAVKREPPDVCLVDDLEFLLLQAPGGAKLLQRTLLFFSRTDSAMFWVATINSLAWQYVSRTAGSASHFATAQVLSPITADVLQEILLNRHERSGMTLTFLPPDDPSPLLRQRLRRAKTDEKRQHVLREVFFDKLFRSAEENVELALFYWLQSASFHAERDDVDVDAVRPLDFRFLRGFDVAASFTLRALLVHKTLTVEEHARVFRSSTNASTFQLEALLNLRMIVPADGRGATLELDRITSSVAYRLRPLLVQPVGVHLRSRNIVYAAS